MFSFSLLFAGVAGYAYIWLADAFSGDCANDLVRNLRAARSATARAGCAPGCVDYRLAGQARGSPSRAAKRRPSDRLGIDLKLAVGVPYLSNQRGGLRAALGIRTGQLTIRSSSSSSLTSSSPAPTRPRTEMPAVCTVSGSPDTSGCH